MSTISPETNANLVRLENSSSYDLDRIVEALLQRGEALQRVAEIVETKISAGEYLALANRNIARLVGQTKSNSLYSATRERFFKQNDVEALVLLYRERYPDPEIEKKLSQILYETAHAKFTDPRSLFNRDLIIRAMGDVGSGAVLPLLEAIAYERGPSLSTKTSFADAIRSNLSESGREHIRREELDPLLDEREEKLLSDDVSKAILAINERLNGTITSNPSDDPLPPGDTLEDIDVIRGIIRRGEETHWAEFKATLGVNLHTNKKDRAMEDEALKTIVAFLNSEGGHLLVGVDRVGRLVGLEPDLNYNKQSKDMLQLYLKDLIKARIGVQHFSNIKFSIVDIDGIDVLVVACQRSIEACFLYDKDFYIRTGPASERLEGSAVMGYIKSHFND